jgi:hypothetical protein
VSTVALKFGQIQIKEELAQFRPLKEAIPKLYAKLHPEWYKSQGKGYQTKINAVLRAHAFG